MKRIWIGIGLLAALLALGIWTSEVMERSQAPGVKDLRRASALALAEDWPRAEALGKRAGDRWKKQRNLTAAIADHKPMDTIDGIFAELEVYAATRDTAAYSASCVHLAQLLESFGNAHSFSWWNLL